VKSFILYCFVVIGLLQGASTTAKIKNSKKDLSLTTSAKKQASRKLGKIAKDIQSAEKDIVYLEKKIDELGKDQDKTQKEYEALKVELSRSQKDFTKTSQDLEQKRKAFITLLSEQFSVIFAMEQSHEPTRKSIISQEVYKAYKKHNTKVLATLKSEISTLKKRKKEKLHLRDKTQKEIKRIVKKREDYAEKKLAKKKLLKKLSGDEEKYNAKLEKIEDKQNSLRSTLAKLNILHTQEVEEARKRAAARKEAMRLEKERKRRIRKEKALARAKAKKAKKAIQLAKTKKAKKAARLAAKKAEKEVEQVQKKATKQSEKVRKINSSYQKSKVYVFKCFLDSYTINHGCKHTHVVTRSSFDDTIGCCTHTTDNVTTAYNDSNFNTCIYKLFYFTCYELKDLCINTITLFTSQRFTRKFYQYSFYHKKPFI